MAEFIILDEVMSETIFEFEGERHQFSSGTFVAVFRKPSEDCYAVEATDAAEILRAIFSDCTLRGYGFVLRDNRVGLISKLEFPNT